MIDDLLGHAARAPESPLVLFKDRTVTFGETASRVLKVAAWLDSLGIETGDRAALQIGNRPGFLFLWLGLIARGAIPVPLNPDMTGDSFAYILQQSGARLLFHEPGAFPDEIDGLTALGFGDEIIEQASDPFPEWEPADLAPNTPVSILYTSGTTGRPKGAVIPLQSYKAIGHKIVDAIGITAQDRILTFLPLFHANPQMYSVMSALTVGCAIALLPGFSASRFLEDAQRHQATGFTYVGTILNILTRVHGGTKSASTLRWCVGGGAPRNVWAATEDTFDVRVHELYGMTETGGMVTINTSEHTRQGSVGVVRDDFDVAVLDRNDAPLANGEIGEIAVRPKAPYVMTTGYFEAPAETVAATSNLWFHTGDLGRFDEDGYLYFEGRTKELIRRAGEMISPIEVETILGRCPGVADCAAVGVPDDVLEEEIKIVVVPAADFDLDAFRAHLAEALPPHMRPRYLETRSTLPKTSTAKIQRFMLKEPAESLMDMRET